MTGSIFKISPAVHRAGRRGSAGALVGRKKGDPVLIRALYKSKLEDQIAYQLEDLGVPFDYEALKLKYIVPEKVHTYTPDFRLHPESSRPIVIESKGYFTPSDRKVISLVTEQHPEIDLRMVFSRAATKIHKTSPTTYGMWCEKHGIKFSDKGIIPAEWIEEAKTRH